MYWRPSHRFDKKALMLANAHYSRQKPQSNQFVAPGKPIVLLTPDRKALWVSLYQKPEFTDHQWKGAWVCSMFRNESSVQSSDLIREAIAITRYQWGEPADIGMITFIDPRKITGHIVRDIDETGVRFSRLTWGYCFQRAGFQEEGWTDSGKLVLRLQPSQMPEPMPGIGTQLLLAS